MFKVTIKIPELHHWRRAGIFVVNFEHISCSSVSIVYFEQVNAVWEVSGNGNSGIQANKKNTNQNVNQIAALKIIFQLGNWLLNTVILKCCK